MEKLRITNSTKKCFGLLIFALISLSSLFAISYSKLLITPEKEFCFSGETSLFTLKIPGVLPVNVDFQVQSTPQNVTVEYYSKEEYLENGTRGTIIKLNFRFSTSGNYQIPSLATRIYWTSYKIKFAPITVYDNPILMEPILTSDLPTTLTVGKPTTFTVYGKFFNELTDINLQLDTNMILKKEKNLKELPYHIGTFSTETYPLAEFTVIPLKEGKFTFPSIYGLFRSYAGNTVTIPLKSTKITVLPQSENLSSEQEIEYLEFFPNALKDSEEQVIQEIQTMQIDLTDILESELNKKQLFLLFFMISNFFLIISLLLIILFHFIKKKSLVITFSAFLFIFLTTTIIFGMLFTNKKAIALGGPVHTVPEEKSNSVMQLTKGDIITINKDIGNWYAIESKNKREGWILKSDCILVNKNQLKALEGLEQNGK